MAAAAAAGPPVSTAAAAHSPPSIGATTPGARLLPWAPLAAVLLTVALFIVVAISVLEKRGQDGSTAQVQRLVDLAITFPGAAGLLAGIFALSRFGSLSLFERIGCVVGTLLCMLIAKSFVLTLLR